MSIDKVMKIMKFDSRLIEYNLNNGTITKEELKTHLQNLPDLADKAEKLDIDDRRSSEEEQH